MKSKNTKKRILVPVDFSTATAPLIAFARQLARDLDATITVLHVIEALHIDWRMDTSALQRQQRLEATRALRQLMKKEFKDPNEARAVLRSGHPVEEIIEFARQSGTDMIVIAIHVCTGMKRALLGSVAERVVRHARCPVVVVR